MKLHEAARQIVDRFGQPVVAETKLANLLADFNGYEDYPAMSKVVRDALKAGYGKAVYECFLKDASQAPAECAGLAKKFKLETGYRNDLITHAFDCILYALGCIDSVEEPLGKGYDAYAKSDYSMLDNLGNQLEKYKKQYVELLDKLAVKPKDLVKDPPGYYSAESMNTLYAVEAKIAAFQQQLGIKERDWCKKKRDERLAIFSRDKSKATAPSLSSLKSTYERRLQELIIHPKFLWVEMSGYYDEIGNAELAALERDIRRASPCLFTPYDNWCGRKKSEFLDQHKVSKKKFILNIFLSMVIPGFFLSIMISYIVSLPDIQAFEKKIAAGERLASKGDFRQAVITFDKAWKEYDGLFNPDGYKDSAMVHIRSTVDEAARQCYYLIDKKKISTADSLLNVLPEEIISSDEDCVNKVSAVRALLEKGANEGLESLISNIYSNGGRLSRQGRTTLDELLAVSPNDYWLNFIKKKRNYSSSANKVVSALSDSSSVNSVGTQQTAATSTVLKVRAKGKAVTELVYLLRKAGYPPNPDKIKKDSSGTTFTTDVSIAVRLFQAYNGLNPDGIVGENTWGKLRSAAQ